MTDLEASIALLITGTNIVNIFRALLLLDNGLIEKKGKSQKVNRL